MHRQAAQRVLAGEVWERETLDYLMQSCGSGDVVHAGTYFGDFLPALARACAGGIVWAFEPNPNSFRCASMTARLNDLSNIELMNAALGAATDTVPMLVKGKRGRDLGGASRIGPEAKEAAPGHAVEVQVVMLDDVVPDDRNISLMHLDVEGLEREAMLGALRTIRRCRPVLVLESLPDRAWLAKTILPLGYKKDGVVDANTILLCT